MANDQRRQAEELFSQWIDEGGDPTPAAVDALCVRHPELSEELRRIAENWISVQGALDDEIGAGNTVEVASRIGEPQTWGPLIEQLRSRGANYERYVFEGEVARGGQGVIHRVYDRDSRRRLALKVMLGRGPVEKTGETPATEAASLGRFLEEAQVTSQLDHPGIVPVHEIGVDKSDQVYFTMKLVKGEDLRAIFDRVADPSEHEWTQTRALHVMLRVCEAMAYAHEKGVIHRDLKPGNIMVGKFGEAYVMDWGLSRVLGRTDSHDIRIQPDATASLRSHRNDGVEDSPILTMDGAVVGTPAYMPPEQAKGRVEELSPCADVYALGAMLYHLMAGSAPYCEPGDRMSARTILALVTQGPPKGLSEVNRDAPSELVAIAEKAMARKIADRYETTQHLAADLRAFLEDRVVMAHRTGVAARVWKLVRRNRSTSTTIAVGGAIVVTVLGWAWQRIDASRDDATRQATERRTSEYFQQISNLSTGFADPALTRERLENTDEDLRGFEYHYLNARLQEREHQLFHGSEVSRIAVDPQSDRFFTAGSDGSLMKWSLAGEGPTALTGHDYPITSITLSPDGRTLVSGDTEGTVRVWNSDTGLLIGEPNYHTEPIADIVFAPNSEFFMTSGSERVIAAWARSHLKEVQILFPINESGVLLALHPSGKQLAAWGAELGGFVTVYELPWLPTLMEDVLELGIGTVDATLRIGTAFAKHSNVDIRQPFAGTEGINFTQLRFSPDGQYLIATGQNGQVSAWDFEAFRQGTDASRPIPPVFSNAASRIQHRFAAPQGIMVRIFAPNGPVSEPYRGHGSRVIAAELHPSDRMVSADESGEILIWNLTRPRALRTLQTGADRIMTVSLSPDRRWALLHENMRSGRLVDLETGAETHLATETAWVAGQNSGFLCDGDLFVLGDYTSAIEIWHTEAGKCLFRESGERGNWQVLATEANGERIARSLANGEIEIVRVDTASALAASSSRIRAIELPVVSDCPAARGIAVRKMTFSPHGDAVAVGYADGTVRLWDPGNGSLLQAWNSADDPVTALGYSPDGSELAACSGVGQVHIWSTESGVRIGEFETRMGRTTGIRYLGASRLVTASEAGPAQLWRRDTGALVMNLGGELDYIRSLDADPAGSTLIAGGLAGRLLVWKTPLDSK